MNANHPQVVENQNRLNDLMRKRARSKKGTQAHRELTARINNMRDFTKIVTQIQSKVV